MTASHKRSRTPLPGRGSGDGQAEDRCETELARREEAVRLWRAEQAEEVRRAREEFLRRHARNLLEGCARAHGSRTEKDFGVPGLIVAAAADPPLRWTQDGTLLEEWCGWGPRTPRRRANRRASLLLLWHWHAAVVALGEAGVELGPEGLFDDHPLAPLFMRAMKILGEKINLWQARRLARDLAKLRSVQGAARYELGSYFEDLVRMGYPLPPPEEQAPEFKPPEAVHREDGEASLPANRDEHLSDTSSILRRMGKGWELRFAGRTVLLTDRIGLKYLHMLVRNSGATVNVQELLDPEREAAPPAVDEATDKKTIDAARKRLAEIDALTQEGLSLVQIEELEAEKVGIEKYLASSTNRCGMPRKTGETEKARTRVAAAIRRALALIKEEHPEAAAHFSENLTDPAGENPVYNAKGRNWVLV